MILQKGYNSHFRTTFPPRGVASLEQSPALFVAAAVAAGAWQFYRSHSLWKLYTTKICGKLVLSKNALEIKITPPPKAANGFDWFISFYFTVGW